MLRRGDADRDRARRGRGGGDRGRRPGAGAAGRRAFCRGDLGRAARGGLRAASRQPRKVWPVRVAAGAFGPGRPHADLWLSPDHAVYVERGADPGAVPGQRQHDRAGDGGPRHLSPHRAGASTTCCWPRDCRRRVFWICGTGRTTRTGPGRCGCIRITPPACGRRSAAPGWSSRGRIAAARALVAGFGGAGSRLSGRRVEPRKRSSAQHDPVGIVAHRCGGRSSGTRPVITRARVRHAGAMPRRAVAAPRRAAWAWAISTTSHAERNSQPFAGVATSAIAPARAIRPTRPHDNASSDRCGWLRNPGGLPHHCDGHTIVLHGMPPSVVPTRSCGHV